MMYAYTVIGLQLPRMCSTGIVYVSSNGYEVNALHSVENKNMNVYSV